MVKKKKTTKNDWSGRQRLIKRLVAFLLCFALFFSSSGTDMTFAKAEDVNAAAEGNTAVIADPTKDGGALLDILKQKEDGSPDMEVLLLANGIKVEEGMEPIDPDDSVLFVRLNNMRLDTAKVKDDTKYRFQLPSTLIPDVDDGPALGEWIQLDQQSGKANAYGRIVQEGTDYYFEIYFTDTKGEDKITASFQYYAEIDPEVRDQETVGAPFEDEWNFDIPLARPERKLTVEKKAEWLSNSGSTDPRNNNTRKHTVSDTTIYRQILYTITITNPKPGESLSLTLTEKLDNGVVAIIPSNGTESQKWIEVKTASGNGGFVKQTLNRTEDLDFAGTNILVKATLDTNITPTKDGQQYYAAKEFAITLTNLQADTIEISYIADVYYTGETESTRTYKSTTSYKVDGEAYEVSATATKGMTSPSLSLTHNYTSECLSSPLASYTGTEKASKFTANFASGGENWVKFVEYPTDSDNSSVKSLFYMYANNFYIGAQLTDFTAGIPGSSSTLLNQSSPRYPTSSNSTNKMNLNSLISNVRNGVSMPADPIVAMEIEALSKKENWDANGDYLLCFASMQGALTSYESHSRYMYMLVAPNTVAGAKNSGNYAPNQTPLQDSNGDPLGFTVYFFNLPDPANGNNLSVTYNKYLSQMIESSDATPNCISRVAVSNGHTQSQSTQTHNVAKNSQPSLTKTGILQEDGSIRWEVAIDLTEYMNWRSWQKSNNNAGPPSKMYLYDLIPDGYVLSGNGTSYDENGMISSNATYQAGTLYYKTGNATTWTSSSPSISWSRPASTDAVNSGMPGKNVYTCDFSSILQQMIETKTNKLTLSYITVPQNASVANVQTDSTLFENWVNVQISDYYLKKAVFDVYCAGAVVVPGVTNKSVEMESESKNGPLNIYSKIESTLTASPSSSSAKLNGPFYLRGVYQISDNMAKSTVGFENDRKLTDGENPAKYIDLQKMTVTIERKSGAPITVQFDSNNITSARATTGYEKKDTASGLTVRLKYTGDMYGGFAITVYGSTEELSKITTEYTSAFDVVTYTKNLNASGILNYDLKNAAARNYSGINNNGGAFEKSAKSFNYAASPTLTKKWLGSPDTGTGRYKNEFEVVADVGPTGQPSVYLVDQVNRIFEYSVLEGMNDPNPKEYDASNPDTVADLKQILDYFKIEGLEIYVGDNRLTQEEGKEVLIYTYSTEGNGHLIDDTYNVTPVEAWSTTLSDIKVPDKDGNQHQDLTGNLYAFQVSRADGTQLSNELYFIIRYTLVLDKNSSGQSFRNDSLYHGGVLSVDSQAAIAYPETVSMSANTPQVLALSNQPVVIDEPRPMAAEGWNSAGAGLSGTYFLNSSYGIKGHSDTTYTVKVNTGSNGIDGIVDMTVTDTLWTHALVDGKLVQDDEKNEAITRLFFQYLTVDVEGIYLEKYADESSGAKERVQIYATNESEYKDIQLALDIAKPDDDSSYEYVSSETNADDEGVLKGYGEGHKQLFKLDASGLPANTDMIIEYRINIDYPGLMKAAHAANPKLLEDDEILSIFSTNILEGPFPAWGDDYEFRDPSSLQGTLVKNADVDADNHTITWSTTLSVNGEIKKYVVSDKMIAGDSKGNATDNDKLALNISDIQSFEIYDISDKTKGPQRIFPANNKPPIEIVYGEPIEIPSSSSRYSKSTITFYKNEDGLGFDIVFNSLKPRTLRLVYTTSLDEDEYIAKGGNLTEGYKLNNAVTAGDETFSLSTDADATVKSVDDSYVLKNAVNTGMAHEQAWKIQASVGSSDAKTVTISDHITSENEDILPYLSITKMKVTLRNGKTDTIIYDSENVTDILSDYTGAWETFALNENGATDFELVFEELAEDTIIIIEYMARVDLDAFEQAGLPKDSYKLSNTVDFKRDGRDDKSKTGSGNVVTSDALSKRGVLLKDENGETAYNEEGQPTIEWTANVYLTAITSVEDLAKLETVSIVDELPNGLRYLEGSVKLYDLATGKELTLEDDYTVHPSGSRVTVELKQPSKHPSVKLLIQTVAYASLESVTNSISVTAGEKRDGTKSESVDKVYLANMSGIVRSVSPEPLQIQAMKYLDGDPSAVVFKFCMEQVDENGQTIMDGTTAAFSSVKSNVVVGDEIGVVTFDETDPLPEGTYYYKIYEVQDTDVAEDYILDATEYILIVQVELLGESGEEYYSYTYTLTDDQGNEISGEKDSLENLTLELLDVLTFSNTSTHSLSVEKQLAGDAKESDKAFTFTVTLKDADGTPLTGTYAITGDNEGLKTITLDTKGSAKFKLKGGETAVIAGIPHGTLYTVEEEEADENGYGTEILNGEGKIDQNVETTFINTRDAGTLHLEKEVVGTPGGEIKYFTFNVQIKDAAGNTLTGDIYYKGCPDAESGPSGKLTFDQTNTASVKLATGEAIDIIGLPNGATVTVAEEEEDGYTADAKTKSGSIVGDETTDVKFVNTYSVYGELDGSLYFNIKKNLEGRAWNSEDTFTFILEAGDDVTKNAVTAEEPTVVMPETTKVTITNDDNPTHTAAFGNILFYAEGNYEFIIREEDGNKGGIDYDTTPRRIRVKVEDQAGNGKYTVTVKEGDGGSATAPLEFTNDYTVEELQTDISVSGAKTLTGREFHEGDAFTFVMTAVSEGAPLPKKTEVTIKPDEDGTGNTFSFGGKADPIIYTKPGTYVYEIYEVRENPKDNTAIPGITYDSTVYRLTVVIKDNEDGTLSVESKKLEKTEDGVTYKAVASLGSANFTNSYSEKETSVSFRGRKVIVDRPTDLQEKEFSFVLEAADGTPMPKGAVSKNGIQSVKLSHEADGSFVFGEITYTADHAGNDPETGKVYRYIVREEQPTVDGTMNGEPLAGAEMVDGKWVYKGVTYDNTIRNITVTVRTVNEVLVATPTDATPTNATVAAADEDGTITEVVYAEVVGNEFEFTNTYEATGTLDGDTYLAVEKVIDGREWIPGDTFTFILDAKDDETKAAVEKGDVILPDTELTITDETEDHSAAFGDILFKKTGDYYFTIREEFAGETIDGITYFATAYTIHVNVSGGEIGGTFDVTCDGDVSAENEPFIFTNEYSVTELSTRVSVSGTKNLSGREFMEGDVFFFLLEAYDDAPLPRQALAVVAPGSDGTGNTFTFGSADDPFIYTEPGTYTYTIRELGPDENGLPAIAGVTYAGTVYRLTVTVVDNLDGTMSVAESVLEKTEDGASYEVAEQAEFVNTYTSRETGITLLARKVLTGREIKAQEFSFVLEAVAGTPMPDSAVVKNDKCYLELPVAADGSAQFDDIIYTVLDAGEVPTEGMVYTYTLREKQPTSDGTMDGKALSGAKLVDGHWIYNDVTYDNSTYSIVVKVWTEDVVEGGITIQVVHAERIDEESAVPVFNNKYDATTSEGGPGTGDSTPIQRAVVILLIAMTMFAALYFKKRKMTI